MLVWQELQITQQRLTLHLALGLGLGLVMTLKWTRGTDIPTTLGKVTGFLVHVGEIQFSGFAVAEKSRVTKLK